MKAIILAVGSELAYGQTVDTNSAFLARALSSLGITPVAHWTVGDDRGQIASAITTAAEAADVVLISGGLGPTPDDLTRQAIADAMGSELRLNERCLAKIKTFFDSRGRKMRPSNRIQAMIPIGAEPLDNPLGTAPGIAARLHRAQLFALPGVPDEMKQMFRQCVACRLPTDSGVIVHRTVHTFGLGESDIGERLEDLLKSDSGAKLGTTVAAGLVSIRITSEATDKNGAERQVDEIAAEIRSRLGHLVVGEDDDTMASAVGKLLRERSQTLATAESCTGGLLGRMITSAPGASEYYLGGVIAYSNAVKRKHLGLPAKLLERHGAVSEPVAAAMAAGCKKQFESDWAIAVTGIAGPDGGTEEKPVGLVYIALAGEGGIEVHRNIFPGMRDVVRLRAATAAMNYLRIAMLPR
ncbi:MAG: competence/damage-inducible protein A [Planctomycetota bacterium]|nr:competence/damage-inducible protein A [Planctomycetota bacterium]